MTSVSISSVSGQPYRQKITAGNHTFYADVPKALGGSDTAPTPHDLALGALGACTSITMQMYANRKNWDLQQVTVNVTEDQVTPTGQTKSIPRIVKDIQVRGNLDDQQLSSLKSVAEKCPVNKLFIGEKQVSSTMNLIA